MEATLTARALQELHLAPVECCTPVASPNITESQGLTLAAVFKALADPSRVQIVSMLANAPEPVCVCDLMPRLRLSQGTVSFHLKKLLDVGLLERQQRGTWAYYSLDRERLDGLADVFATREASG